MATGDGGTCGEGAVSVSLQQSDPCSGVWREGCAYVLFPEHVSIGGTILHVWHGISGSVAPVVTVGQLKPSLVWPGISRISDSLAGGVF